jgi:aminoglycoside phosphotransferase (APT) family kinase protein
VSESAETIAVRPDETLPLDRLKAFLKGTIDDTADEIAIEQFPHGHSNLTYLLRAGGREFVLRRPPLGPLAHRAHDMAREFRVLSAVHPRFSQAPAPVCLCEDPQVLGAPFFLMERRSGIVLRDRVPPEVSRLPDGPARVSQAFLETLVQLHAVPLDREQANSLGKPEGYVERQVRGWAERWDQAKTEEAPEVDAVIRWLASHIPPPLAPTLIHNDYKLDNLILSAASPDRVEAVLDWEMATVGDPLSDLGLTLCYWVWAAQPEVRMPGIPALTEGAGWYTRGRLIDGYAARSGRDLSHIGYYEVLGIFKLAVIVQQIYCRFHRGQTRDERFRSFEGRGQRLGALAARLAENYG